MFIHDFVREHKDRYLIVFAEETPYTMGRANAVIRRSSFALLYDTYLDKYVLSAWDGQNSEAAYGPSADKIFSNLLEISTANDFDRITMPKHTEQWAAMFKNFIGNETLTAAFNRLEHPLKTLGEHQSNIATAARFNPYTKMWKFGNRFVAYNKEHCRQVNKWVFEWGKLESPANELDFSGFPPLLEYRKTLSTLKNGRVVRYSHSNGNLVVQFNAPSDFYYLHLLKEQQVMQSKWSYKIKRLFGKAPKSSGFAVEQKLPAPKDPDEYLVIDPTYSLVQLKEFASSIKKMTP